MMVVSVPVSRWGWAVVIGIVVMCGVGSGRVLAQDASAVDPSASPREKELRQQLNTILQELDEMQQKK